MFLLLLVFIIGLVQKLAYPAPKNWQDFFLKPGVFPEPYVVARTGMRQRERLRPVLLPVLHCFGEAVLLPRTQMPGLRILANDQSQLNIWQKGQKLLAPLFPTFRPWRQIAGLAGSGVTKTHGKKGNSATVIKHSAINSHPVTQTVTARIIERNSSLVHPPARRLRDNQNAGRLTNLKNRPRPQMANGVCRFRTLLRPRPLLQNHSSQPGYRSRQDFRPAPSAQARSAALPASSCFRAIASQQSPRLAGISATSLQHRC
jgi:hypothetical protein